MSTSTRELPMILAEVEVVAVERLSPSFVRVGFGGEALADLGVDGPLYDQRIKLVFAHQDGRLPRFEDADASWFSSWQALPEVERGHMRTYTIRRCERHGAETTMWVDFVLHRGASGPGGDWAARARVGDRLVTVAPRRGVPFGGIEFAPGGARDLLLVGDETAVPAICSILEDLPATASGAAFLEVPVEGDVQSVTAPPGVRVVWLPRGRAAGGEAAAPGALLDAAVRRHLGTGRPEAGAAVREPEPVPDPEPGEVWETPTWSAAGEPLDVPGSTCSLTGLYAWIAGESAMVTGLRRHLVAEVGIDRRQVAFMGYWRRGVAMRS